jgi:hypothetical protein
VVAVTKMLASTIQFTNNNPHPHTNPLPHPSMRHRLTPGTRTH